jgi:hypothetical protein
MDHSGRLHFSVTSNFNPMLPWEGMVLHEERRWGRKGPKGDNTKRLVAQRFEHTSDVVPEIDAYVALRMGPWRQRTSVVADYRSPFWDENLCSRSR